MRTGIALSCLSAPQFVAPVLRRPAAPSAEPRDCVDDATEQRCALDRELQSVIHDKRLAWPPDCPYMAGPQLRLAQPHAPLEPLRPGRLVVHMVDGE